MKWHESTPQFSETLLRSKFFWELIHVSGGSVTGEGHDAAVDLADYETSWGQGFVISGDLYDEFTKILGPHPLFGQKLKRF